MCAESGGRRRRAVGQPLPLERLELLLEHYMDATYVATLRECERLLWECEIQIRRLNARLSRLPGENAVGKARERLPTEAQSLLRIATERWIRRFRESQRKLEENLYRLLAGRRGP